jgi:hypothetical protein
MRHDLKAGGDFVSAENFPEKVSALNFVEISILISP